MRSRLAAQRTGFTALKRILLMVYYTHPRSWPGIGYRGPALQAAAPAAAAGGSAEPGG
jgi:hypothetical protein